MKKNLHYSELNWDKTDKNAPQFITEGFFSLISEQIRMCFIQPIWVIIAFFSLSRF